MTDLHEFTEGQAARMLGVSAVTLRRWRGLGVIGHHRMPGGRIRYSLDQIANFRSRCRVDPIV